jgi:hypothetical protein
VASTGVTERQLGAGAWFDDLRAHLCDDQPLSTGHVPFPVPGIRSRKTMKTRESTPQQRSHRSKGYKILKNHPIF